MNELPQSLVIFRPKRPFLGWLNGLPDAAEQLTLEEVRDEPDGYLVPEFEAREEALAFIEPHASRFFGDMLFNWCNEREWWRAERDFKTLGEWFDIEFLSTVMDASSVISPPTLN